MRCDRRLGQSGVWREPGDSRVSHNENPGESPGSAGVLCAMLGG